MCFSNNFRDCQYIKGRGLMKSEITTQNNPFVIKCKSCGALSEFDILRQNHS